MVTGMRPVRAVRVTVRWVASCTWESWAPSAWANERTPAAMPAVDRSEDSASSRSSSSWVFTRGAPVTAASKAVRRRREVVRRWARDAGSAGPAPPAARRRDGDDAPVTAGKEEK